MVQQKGIMLFAMTNIDGREPVAPSLVVFIRGKGDKICF